MLKQPGSVCEALRAEGKFLKWGPGQISFGRAVKPAGRLATEFTSRAATRAGAGRSRGRFLRLPNRDNNQRREQEENAEDAEQYHVAGPRYRRHTN